MIARSMILGGVAAVLFVPGTAAAQIVAGLGVNSIFGQQQFGAPPAGVGLHQQYMQLYGLPTTFTQGGTVNNGGGTGIFPGYGGGFGGIPRYFGVNYARRLAAAQAYQNYYNNSGYAMVGGGYYQQPTPNHSQSQSSQPSSYQSFGMAPANPPSFNQFAQTSNRPSPGFGGFGLTSTANPFLLNQKKDEKKEEKKDEAKD